MAALLSPTKPVRTRFKVPGEGSYDLSLDLSPPLARAHASHASISSSGGGGGGSATSAAGGLVSAAAVATGATSAAGGLGSSAAGGVSAASGGASASAGAVASSSASSASAGGASGANSSSNSSSSASKSSPGGNPLGLAHISKLSFAAYATLQQPDHNSNNASSSAGAATASTMSAANNISSASSTAAGSAASLGTAALSTSTGTAATNTTATAAATTTSSLFSFRKLTGLSLSKLSGNGADDDAPAASSTTTRAQLPPSQTPSSSAGGNNNATSGAPSDANAMHPRAPPRIASSSVHQSKPPPPPSPQQQRLCSGVMGYNAGEALVLLDVGTRATSELPLQPSSWAKSTLSAHALTLRDGLLRAVIGLANGEVLYFPDIISAANAATARRNAAAASAANSSSGSHLSMMSMSMSMSMSSYTSSSAASSHIPPPVIYNRDGVLNHSRVVALRWLPNFPCDSSQPPSHSNSHSQTQSQALGFVAVHADGVVLVHDARQRPTTVAAAAAAAAVAAAAATAGGRSMTTDDTSTTKGDMLNSSNNSASATDIAAAAPGVSVSDRPSHRRTSSVNAVPSNSNGGTVMGPLDVVVTRQTKPKKGVTALNHNGHTHSAIWQLGRATATACDLIRINTTISSKGSSSHNHNGPNNNSNNNNIISNTTGNDALLLAVAGRDGYLRIVDLISETPVIALRSYFGALLCVAWSPDGRYVAAGGEDDLITIWAVADQCVVARLEGHTSWVSAVAWDAYAVNLDGSDSAHSQSQANSFSLPPASSPPPPQVHVPPAHAPHTISPPVVSQHTQKRYRIGSAGQDAKLLLWDFSLDSLMHRRSSTSSAMHTHYQQQQHQQQQNHHHHQQNAMQPVPQQNQRRHVQPARNVQQQQQQNNSTSRLTTGSGWKSGKLGRLRGPSLITGGNHNNNNVNSNNNSNTNGGTTTIAGDDETDIANSGSGTQHQGNFMNSSSHSSTGHLTGSFPNGGVCPIPVVVPAPRRADVPIVEPVAVHVAHGEPLTDVWFDENGVFTADAVGGVKLWARPPQHAVPELSLGKGRVSATATESIGSGAQLRGAIRQVVRPSSCSDLD